MCLSKLFLTFCVERGSNTWPLDLQYDIFTQTRMCVLLERNHGCFGLGRTKDEESKNIRGLEASEELKAPTSRSLGEVEVSSQVGRSEESMDPMNRRGQWVKCCKELTWATNRRHLGVNELLFFLLSLWHRGTKINAQDKDQNVGLAQNTRLQREYTILRPNGSLFGSNTLYSERTLYKIGYK